MNQEIAIGGRKKVIPEEVILIASDCNYSKVYFTNKPSVIVAKTLKQLSLGFENEFSFVRIHKSTLVNTHFIKEAIWEKPQAFLILSNNFRVAVARRNRLKVLNRISENECV